jgi:uncharacterized membrane protein
MIMLVLAILAFVLLHIALVMRGMKDRTHGNGKGSFQPIYIGLNLLALIAVVWAFRNSGNFEIYDAPAWGRYANFCLTLLAFVCVGIFLFRGSWRRALRFPLAIGVILCGTGHLLANGDAANILFFAGLMLTSVVHVLLVARVQPVVQSEQRSGHNLLSVMFGIALYAVFSQLHGVITGVPVMELTL